MIHEEVVIQYFVSTKCMGQKHWRAMVNSIFLSGHFECKLLLLTNGLPNTALCSLLHYVLQYFPPRMVYPHQFPLQQPSPRLHFLPNTNFPHPLQMQGYMVSATSKSSSVIHGTLGLNHCAEQQQVSQGSQAQSND